MAVGLFSPSMIGESVRVGIVQARFNEDICRGLTEACLLELKNLGVTEENMLQVTVPGALDLPVALQKMAETLQFSVLIAIGAVIRGQTYHFEVVSNESAAGIIRVGIDYGIAIVNAVLTTDTDAQAKARIAQKGIEAARGAVEMANLTLALGELARATRS